MSTESQILAVLTGAKVFDGHTWRVYDASGAEIADAGGVLWRGVNGALLWSQNQNENASDWLIRARQRGKR